MELGSGTDLGFYNTTYRNNNLTIAHHAKNNYLIAISEYPELRNNVVNALLFKLFKQNFSRCEEIIVYVGSTIAKKKKNTLPRCLLLISHA